MNRAIIVASAVALVLSVSMAGAAEEHDSRHSAHEHRADPGSQAEHGSRSDAHPSHDESPHDAHGGHHPLAHVDHEGSHQAGVGQRHQHSMYAAHAKLSDDQPTESELQHVPPPPPEHPMPDVSPKRMEELMQMTDTAAIGMVLFDQLEWRNAEDADALKWNAHAWYGNDYNKLWAKSEGSRVDGDYESRNELLWDRIFARWWSMQAGVRYDTAEGPSRTWAAFGVQGLAPQWFQVEATLYVGEEGRTAARASAEYDLRFTQRLILQPELEVDAYGKDDPANGIGSGLSDMELGLRLRYEIRREFAPYVGVVWKCLFGETADLARERGAGSSDTMFVAGVRAWF